MTRRWFTWIAIAAALIAVFPSSAWAQRASVVIEAAAAPACVVAPARPASCLVMSLINVQSVGVNVTGSGTYTLEFEVSIDGGATWVRPGFINLDSRTRENSTTTSGAWMLGNAGYSHLRIRASAYTSGAPRVTAMSGYGGVNDPVSVDNINLSGADGALQDGTDPGIEATVRDYAGSNPLAVVLTDTDGAAYVASGGGGGGGASQTDNTALASVAGAGALYDTSPPSVTDGNVGAVRMSSDRYLYTVFPSAQSVALSGSVPAGTNNIGDVDVASIAAGDNNIGNVDIVSMPADATELPAAAALADNTPNPTVPGVGAYLMGFETTWDRLTSTSGSLNVNITGGAGSGGTAIADDGDFTAGTTSFTPVGGFYQSTVTACTDGDTCAAGITTGRAVKVALANADGSLVTYQTDATEDAAESNGVTGPVSLTVRRDTAASSAGTTGDYATANTDALGRLWARDGNPCADHARISTAAISTSASGNVEIVALNGSDLIYVCGYSIVAGAATGVRFVYGTGSACATGETGLTGVWSFAANGGITQANAGAPQFVVPAGNAFCVENSDANAIAGHVTYVRTAAP